jgi:CheY-like chemotaxis protein
MTMLDLSQVAGLRLVDPGRVHPAGLPQAPPAPERLPARALSELPERVGSAPISAFEAGALPAAAAPPTAVALPVPAPIPTAPPVQPAPATGAGPERAQVAPAVLIVDDNVRLASTVAAYMEMQGFRAHPAHSAEEALFAAQQVPFDVVLLDINMPGMDGLEVCHRLLATAPGMRVLMVTGRDSEEDPLRAAAVGARGLLTKPISLATLRDEILRALAS